MKEYMNDMACTVVAAMLGIFGIVGFSRAASGADDDYQETSGTAEEKGEDMATKATTKKAAATKKAACGKGSSCGTKKCKK